MPDARRRMLRASAAALATLVVCPTLALAQPREPDTQLSSARSGRRLHNGFYFRIGSGFAVYDERLQSDDGSADRSGRNRGVATLGELAVGGTVGGWVIGGGIYAADVVASTFRSRTAPPPAELDPGLRNAALIGPFLDWYMDPERGLHLQGALGLATLTPRVFGHDSTEQSEYLALGAGLMLGAGYDFFVADEWSLGVLARTTVSVLGGEDDASDGWLHVVTTSPGLLVSLTYH